jgi:hypothetical protein
MEAEQEQKTASVTSVRVEGVVIPLEVLDLVRFMCATWAEIDRWAYKHCDSDALALYPVIQGTANQLALTRIGEEHHTQANVRKAVEWMQRYNGVFRRAPDEA